MKKLILTTFALSAFATSANALEIAGVWLTEAGNGQVTISDCGDGTPCGHLTWIDPATSQGVTNDVNNPDPELQKRDLIGSEVFWGFKSSGSGWGKGKIYDAESGKTYKSKIKLQDDGTLQVKGCVGPICQGQTWTRVE